MQKHPYASPPGGVNPGIIRHQLNLLAELVLANVHRSQRAALRRLLGLSAGDVRSARARLRSSAPTGRRAARARLRHPDVHLYPPKRFRVLPIEIAAAD